MQTLNEIIDGLSICTKTDEEVDSFIREQETAMRDSAYRNSGIIGQEMERANVKMLEGKQKTAASIYTKKIKAGQRASLIITGEVGTGKTTMGCAILKYLMHQVKESQGGINIYFSGTYTTSKTICSRLHQAEGYNATETRAAILRELYESDILVIDEVGRAPDKYEPAQLFSVIDERYNRGRSTILISNMGIKEISDYIGLAALSRLNMHGGLVVTDTTGMPDRRRLNGEQLAPAMAAI